MKTNRLLAIAMALVASLLVVVPTTASTVQAQTPEAPPTIDKGAPTQVLAGENITYTLTARNPGSTPLFNVTFRDVLPLGVAYAGSTTPDEIGDPQIIRTPVIEPVSGLEVFQQTLIWQNVTDLQAGDSFAISFAVSATIAEAGDNLAREDLYAVGSTVDNDAFVYGSTNERSLPTFDQITGEPEFEDPASPNFDEDILGGSDSSTTTLTAIEVTKSEPSPEGELLRGVHDFVTTYTLTVDVTDEAGVDNVVLTDLLPAELEFLGCGDEDNSLVITDEWGTPPDPVSGPLGGSPVAGCIEPDTVETVVDPTYGGVAYTGVFTLVTWRLTDLVPGQRVVRPYAAGIPLRANVAFADPPPAIDGAQGSNLDNNTGASTRETAGGESAVTNRSIVSGEYLGLLDPTVVGTTVSDEDDLTRTIEDVRIVKRANRTDFSTSGLVRYTITVDTSEYVSATDIVLTDYLPNGLCPLGNIANSNTSPCNQVLAAGNPSNPSPVLFESVDLGVSNGEDPPSFSGGGFTIVFQPLTLERASSTPVSYTAYMRPDYQGGSLNGRPTVSGDTFTNTVSSTATTTAIPGVPPGLEGVETGVADGSRWTLVTGEQSIDKKIRVRDAADRLDPTSPAVDRCPDPIANDPDYIDADQPLVAADVDRLGFRLGDQVCFLLSVDFDDVIQTRAPIITDFLPPGLEYVANSMRQTTGHDVDFAFAEPANLAGPLQWDVGTVDDGIRYVGLGPNNDFQVVFAAEVVTVPTGTRPIVTGNLMKMRTENSDGSAQSYRDASNLGITPVPPIGLVKGVERIDNPSQGPFDPNSDQDDLEVRQGATVRVRIDLRNLGQVADFNNYSVRDLDVIDILPNQLTCAAIPAALISNFGPDPTLGECLAFGDTDYPFAVDRGDVIRWQLGPGVDEYALFTGDRTALPLRPGCDRTGNAANPGTNPETCSLFYTMNIPAQTSIDEVFDNTAGVRSYSAFTNLQFDTSPPFIPRDNIDPTFETRANAEPAIDDSSVFVPGARVTKAGDTSVQEANNDVPVVDPIQAVPGETVTYTYAVEIPGDTSVFDGVLSDALPADIVLFGAALGGADPVARYYPDASDTSTPQPLPGGFAPNALAADGTLTFPPVYSNNEPTTARFEVELTTRVRPGFAGQAVRTNTASFESTSTATPSATFDVSIRQPRPSLLKSNDTGDDRVVAGDVVQYTLRARANTSTGNPGPPIHDAVITDCIPAGMTYLAGQAANDDPLTSGPTPSNGTDGCEAGTNRITFDVGTVEPGTNQFRRYSVRVNDTAAGGQTFTNRAFVTSSSLDDAGNDSSRERVITSRSENTVEVPGADPIKTVTPERATIGEQVEYTIRITVPADINFYEATILDQIPAGLDPDTVAEVPGSAVCTPGVGAPVGATCSADFDLLGPEPTPTPPPGPPGLFGPGGSLVGLYFDDVLAEPFTRTFEVKYTAIVADIGENEAQDVIVNRAASAWNTDPGLDPPASPSDRFQNYGIQIEAPLDVIEPDVGIAKTVSDANPEPGDPPFTYTLVVTNGPDTFDAADPNDPANFVSGAYNLTVTDLVPAGIVVDRATISDGGVYDESTRTITWSRGTPGLADGPLCGLYEAAEGLCTGPTQLTLTYRATLDASSTLQTGVDLVNTAGVPTYFGLPEALQLTDNARIYRENPTDQARVTPAFPELTVAKSASGEPTYIDDEYRWTVLIENTGDGVAYDVALVDDLPPNWAYVENSAEVTFTPLAPGAPTTGPAPPSTGACAADICWVDLGDLQPGETFTLTYLATAGADVVVDPGVGSAVRQVNSVVASALDGSDAPGNSDGNGGIALYQDDSTASTRIDQVDLLIEKSHDPDTPPIAGEEFSWRIDVSNQSTTDTAVGPFVVTDTLPTTTGVEFVSATGDGWICVPGTGPTVLAQVTCTRRVLDLLPDILGPAGSGTEAFDPITITVRTPSDLPDGTVISNTASVAGRTYEDPADIARDNTSTDTATVITRADLRIVKQLTTNLIAGNEANYSLAVTNGGPSTSRATAADPITVVDTLPAGARFVSVDGGPTWACRHDGSALGGIVTCDRDTDLPASPLPGSAAPIINVRIAVPSGATGAFVNTAEVALGPDNLPITTDPIPGNNRSITTTIIGTDADLAIEKEWLGPAVPGEPTVYQIKVDNLGPSDALSIVQITDTLPAGLTYKSSSDVTGEWACAATAGGFTCDLTGPLASQASATVQIEVDVAPSVIGVVNNTARVDSTTTPDTRQANNETIEPATFVGSADLEITKTSDGPAVPGGPISWTIGVQNLGPSDSVGPITVTDVLPAGVLGPVAASGTGWDCTGTVGTTVSCVRSAALGTVPPGSMAPPITVTAVADPSTPGPDPIVNTASVVGTTADSDDTNNSASSQTNVIEPSVALDKRVDDATPEPGDTFTYTLDLSNASGADATAAYNLVVTDVVPTGVVVDQATISNGGLLVGDTITWNVAGPLGVGATLDPPLSYEARLAPSADIDRTPLVNTATLESYESLPVGGRSYSGNSDTATVTPQFPQLFTEKAVVQDVPAFIGDPFAWVVTVTNTGDGTAFDVAVIDTLPTNWVYVPGSTVITRPAGQPTLTDDPAILNGVATWAPLGALAPGESLTVAFRATPTAAVAQDPGVGSDVDQVNTARSTAEDATDATASGAGDYGSDDATAVAIIEAADVIIDKAPSGTPVAGSTFAWTLSVTNNTGVDTAVGPFVVTDTLPPEVSYVGAVGDGWSCTESAGTVTCNRTNADDVLTSPGGFPAITVTVAIPSDFEGDLTNTASVTSRTADLDLTNNNDTDVVTVVGVADLGIVKNRTNAVILAGTPTTYTLDVTNFGPSTSRADIVVTDTLPPEVTFVSAPTLPTSPAEPWDCVHNGVDPGGVVTCTLADPSFNSLSINQSAPSIAIEVAVAANAEPNVDIINRARVAGTTTDPNPANDTASNIGRPDVSADLVINKQVDAGGLIAGEEASYQLRVFNNGPSDSQSVVINDDLPDTLTYVGFTSSTASGVFGTWNCTPAADNGSFTCELDAPLPPNRFAIVDVTVLVDEGVTDPVINTATVSSPTPDPNLGNNTDSDTVSFDAQADLSLLKTRPTTPVIAGERVTWTLTVTNNGPSTSQPNIVVSDPLPDTVEFVSATGTGWSCTTAPSGVAGFSDTVTCTRATALLADTANDANVAPPITIEADVLPTAGPGVIVNTASVRGETFDPDPTNDSSTSVVPVIDRVDVQIVKAPQTQTVLAGENATFTLTVTNNGPSTADSVVISDLLPSGMTVVSASGSTSLCVTPTPVSIQCALGALDPFDPAATPPGPTEVVTVVAKVGSGVVDGAELTNLATVSTSTTDTDPSNNSDTAIVEVVSESDLAIAKSHPVDPVVAGDPMTFEIVVSNLGPSDALAPIAIVDTLPTGFRYLSATGPWACTPRPGSDPQIVDCTLRSGGTDLGLIGGTPTAPTVAPALLMTVQVDPSLDPSDTAGTYDNVAVVDYPTDPNDTNDTATDPVNVVTSVNISIEKTHDPDEVRIGENLRFILAVTNDGPSEARNIVVRDRLPAGLTLVGVAGSSEPSSWDCSETSAPDVVCRLTAPLPPGADAEGIIVTALVEPTAFPSVANTAVVSTTTAETDPSDNVATDVVLVPRLVDLFVEKQHAGPVVVGGEILYTLTVGNNGPIDDDGVVTVVDDVPAGLRVTDATSILAECVVAGQRVTCTKANGLAVGDTFLIFIRAEVLPGAYPSVTNTAEVSSPTDDSNPLNNTASDVATVPPLVDLAITKTHTGTVQVGGQITYTVTVRNNGPTPDPGPVRMLDTLPGSLTPVSATADGMTCTITGQTVACQALAPLAVGAQLVVTIVADVGPGAFPSVSNTAIVTTPGCVVGPAALDAACPDTNLDNNTATDIATVAPLVLLGVQKTLASLEASTATWSIVVTNLGSNATVDPIRMTDNLPNTLAYVSAAGDGWLCTNFGQTVGCTYSAPLAPGVSAPPISIVTLVNAPAGTSITNVATVDGGGPGVPEVTDNGNVIAPVRPPLPTTGGGPGVVLQWAPLLMLLGLGMVLVAKRRRTNHAS